MRDCERRRKDEMRDRYTYCLTVSKSTLPFIELDGNDAKELIGEDGEWTGRSGQRSRMKGCCRGVRGMQYRKHQHPANVLLFEIADS